MRPLKLLLAAASAVLVAGGPGNARANGRFPAAQAIETVPGSDGSTMFLRATFGFLVSRDRGRTWRFLCERALGYSGSWDPPIAVTRDGRLWVGLQMGLVSTADGCAVDVSSDLDGVMVKDLTTDRAGDSLWALTSSRGTLPAAVWRASAGPQRKWQRTGTLPEGMGMLTLEVAASNPSRIYVTAQPAGRIQSWLFRSDNGGKTFEGAATGLTDGGLFIAAIDPIDANRVLFRQVTSTGTAIVITKDGGKTFSTALHVKSAIPGFAKSADGETYFAGASDDAGGFYRSTDRGEHFALVSNHGVLCLHLAPRGVLWACGNAASAGAPAVEVSTDQGKTITPLVTFGDVKGPLACDGDAELPGAVCGAAWPEVQMFITADRTASARDSGAGADASGNDAGTPPRSTEARRSACGCLVVGGDRAPARSFASVGLLAVVLHARARRRRREKRSWLCGRDS